MQNLRPCTSHHPSRMTARINNQTALSSGLMMMAALFLTVFGASTFCHARSLEMEQERLGSNREPMWVSPLGLQMSEFQTRQNLVGLISGTTVGQVAASLTSSRATRGASEVGGYAGLPLLVGMACWLRFRQFSRFSRRFHGDDLKW